MCFHINTGNTNEVKMYNVHIGLTNACNLNCKHCYVKNKEESINNVINEDVLIDCIEKIGSSIITYTCGENLLYKNFYSFAERANKRGFYQILISNGLLIHSPSVVSDLESIGINQINISLDSAKKETHDINRGKIGSFDAAINALSLIKSSNKIKPLIATTVSNQNLNELFDIIMLGEKLGVESFSFMRERDNCGLSPIHDDYYGIMQDIVKYSFIKHLNLHLHDYTLNTVINSLYCSNKIDMDLFERLTDMNTCHIYDNLVLITPCGNVYPCVFSTKPIGNIYSDSLINIFKKKKYESFCTMKG